jgi:hypothetical protein
MHLVCGVDDDIPAYAQNYAGNHELRQQLLSGKHNLFNVWD